MTLTRRQARLLILVCALLLVLFAAYQIFPASLVTRTLRDAEIYYLLCVVPPMALYACLDLLENRRK